MSTEHLNNDKELLDRISNGDESAFAALYNRYWKKVYSMAFMYVRSPQAAQDIVQDVFLKIWINRENLQHIQEFRPYFFVTARNIIISSLRNTVFHQYLTDDEQQEESILLPEKMLSFKESVNLLHKAIETLPPQQQRAYRLSRNEGLSYEEIAQEMGISRLTVRTHITKALGTLRKYLTDKSVNPLLLILLVQWGG